MKWLPVVVIAACVAPTNTTRSDATNLEALPPVEADAAAEVVREFVTAVKAGHFDAALALTTTRWRQHLSPERFRADFDIEPLAPERLSRIERALAEGVLHTETQAELRLEGRVELVLLREGDLWRVDQLRH